MSSHQGGVLIVDFGTQYCQLIARRIREMGVYSRITVPDRVGTMLEAMRPDALVLSGGPRSVYEADAPKLDPAILGRGLPVLGICYGLQWLTGALGGRVEPARDAREYGRTEMRVIERDVLLDGVDEHSVVWMSHGDHVAELPPGFRVLASSKPCPVAAAADPDRRIYGLQFHPEVTHTVQGERVLRNFVLRVAGCRDDWHPGDVVQEKVRAIRAQVGEHGEVVLGLSGGVDSSVAAVLVHKAIGPRLHCVFVDNGLLRKGEREAVEVLFRDEYRMDLHVVDARARFLGELAGVSDPEQKRKIIGRVFVEVFREKARALSNAQFLGQGTLYPDVIESVAAHGGATATIKSHHNVGGLPEDLDLELVEPLRDLFKDEVRQIGRELGLPSSLVDRQPFPGPGLAVRCLGEVTEERLVPLREADAIVREEVESRGLHEGLWQYFAVSLPVRSVGVMGDQRTYENACVVRVVSSLDAMTADWELLPVDVLRRISNRIINEVPGLNRVCLDISSKPPSTIEWE
ncbi:MAG: glutamine-hydrolyzing GMP synthase [Planctomycetes bacterium]|nr:glutamine-hydrolyzing GMP synthase [Planctomycetota bacterium]